MQSLPTVPRRQLQDVLDWAQSRISAGEETPWSRYQHMRLVEAIRSISPTDDQAPASADAMDETPIRSSDWPITVLS